MLTETRTLIYQGTTFQQGVKEMETSGWAVRILCPMPAYIIVVYERRKS